MRHLRSPLANLRALFLHGSRACHRGSRSGARARGPGQKKIGGDMPPLGRLVLRAALDALALAGLAVRTAMLATLTVLAVLAWGAAPVAAATPPSGTLTDAGGPVSYTAGPFFASNASAQANGTPICNAALACDQFALTVTLSPAVAAANKVKIEIQWPLTTADFDLYVFDSTNTLVGQSATTNDPETVILPAVNGGYTVLVAPL